MGLFEFLLILFIALKLMGYVSMGWGVLFGAYILASLVVYGLLVLLARSTYGSFFK